jgi:RHS repeat-associated protein
MARNTSARQIIKSLALLTLTVFILSFGAEYGFSYNWPWDQGHDCVETKKGSGNWGRWDYDGNWKGTYTSKECCELLCKICPVYANTGQYQKTFTDLTVPGIGPSLNITRTYNSQEWASSLLGHGWVFNFGRRLIITRNKAGEKVVGVLLETGEKNFFKEYSDGTLERLTDYGITYDLIKNTDNTYTIVSRNGTWYELREDGKIAKIIDRNQNELVFSYNSVGCLSRITNASGNYVDFQLGVNGKIASVSDNLGRTVAYGYNENGNLMSVTDPMGNVTQYVYNSNNLLAQIIDARGNVVESAAYDNNQPPRVSTFTEKGETYTIAYFDGRTEKTDSQGNKWTYYFNELGIIERVIDPLGNETKQQPNKITSTSVEWEEDANGNRTTYTYDADGNIASKTDPLGNTWTYTYIAGTDLLATETNPLGVVTKYEYDGKGNQTAIIRDFGGALENRSIYTYDSQGNQTSVTDPLGNTTAYEYDANGNLIKTTDPLGNVTTYTYDNRCNMITETDAKGNTTTYAYNLMDRLISVADALGNSTTYAYDADGNRISETDANGKTKTFAYDAYNRLIQEQDPLGNTTSYIYDSKDNRTSMTDANGNKILYEYDANNRLSKRTDSLGKHTDYTYDAAGNILTITDGNGKITTYAYDALNRIISETDPAGETTAYVYDNNGNMINTTFQNGKTILKTYDRLNQLTVISDTLGVRVNYVYDESGRLIREVDALGNTTVNSYDASGRLTEKTDPNGNNITYQYDAVGNIVSITDREGNTISYCYDGLNRRSFLTDPLGFTVSFSYDAVGNMIQVIDNHGNITNYVYDGSNRLTEEIYADGTTRFFDYDGVGNVVSRKDQNGINTNYSYDAYNRTTKIDYPGTNDSQFTYDAVGNLLTANNEYAFISLTYDDVYRLTQSIQNGRTVSYSYDISNNAKIITYPTGKIVKEVRNARGSLTDVENNLGQKIVQYTYDDVNRVRTKEYLNGITSDFTYNANGWITDLNYNDGTSQILGFQYGYDKEGNKLYLKKLHDLLNSERYIYDAKHRLIQFEIGALDGNYQVPNPVTQTAYNLDALGNWLNKATDGITENRNHNKMNEIIDINGIPLLYDNNGNLLEDGINLYEHDYENRLIKVSRKTDRSILGAYKYDALGRRIEKQTSVVTTTYYYDENRVIEEQVDGSTDVIYVYGIGVDEVLTMECDNNTSYFHTDSLRNVVALTDSFGRITEQYSYDAYGDSSPDSSAIGNFYRFTSRRFDDETELYYFRARYYSAEKGRFLQKDPLYASTYSQKYILPPYDLSDFNVFRVALNHYEYVRSRPTYYVDPFGLQEEECEKYCGPNVTTWLINQMNANKNHPVIKTSRENVWADLIPFFNIGWNYGFFTDFKNLVKAGAPWDFKASQSFKTKSCPSKGCERTVTMCGICFDYDVPGNIHYGWVGVAARIRPWFLHNRAAAAQKGGVDDPGDTVAIDIGISMWREGKALCPTLRKFRNNLRLGPKDCENCPEAY